MSARRLTELLPAALEAQLEATPILVLPIGTIEWHSHHAPLGLDGLVAEGISERIADRLGAVLAPTSYWAVGGVPYPFTLQLGSAVIEPLLDAALRDFARMGFRVIVLFTGHFGLDHTLAVKRAALRAMRRAPVTVLPLTPYDLVTDLWRGDHAGAGETSLLWHLHPYLVDAERLEGDALDGVLGEDPRGAASAERGRELTDAIVERAAAFAARLAAETSRVARADYEEAIAAAVRVLAATAEARGAKPKALVPSPTTPAYLAHLEALRRGAYRDAKAHAERKLADLSA